MADKKSYDPIDRHDLSSEDYGKQIKLLESIFEREMNEYIFGSRKKAVHNVPEQYYHLRIAWGSFHRALMARKPGALSQSWNFMKKRVGQFVLHTARADALNQIRKLEVRFTAGKKSQEARRLFDIADNTSLKIEERIAAAKRARFEAAKSYAAACREEENRLAQLAKNAEEKKKEPTRQEKRRVANSRKAKKAQRAVLDSLSIPASG